MILAGGKGGRTWRVEARAASGADGEMGRVRFKVLYAHVDTITTYQPTTWTLRGFLHESRAVQRHHTDLAFHHQRCPSHSPFQCPCPRIIFPGNSTSIAIAVWRIGAAQATKQQWQGNSSKTKTTRKIEVESMFMFLSM